MERTKARRMKFREWLKRNKQDPRVQEHGRGARLGFLASTGAVIASGFIFELLGIGARWPHWLTNFVYCSIAAGSTYLFLTGPALKQYWRERTHPVTEYREAIHDLLEIWIARNWQRIQPELEQLMREGLAQDGQGKKRSSAARPPRP